MDGYSAVPALNMDYYNGNKCVAQLMTNKVLVENNMGIFRKMIFKFFNKKEKSVKSEFTSDKADWHWESAVEEYCKIHKVDLDFDNLDEDVENIIWEYAGNHIACFLVWIIQRDFYNPEMFEAKDIQLIKDEKITGTEFLMDYCDGKFFREFMSEDILAFVDSYYDTKYISDYCFFVEHIIKGTVYGMRFSWDACHQLELFMDGAYKAYKRFGSVENIF